jgi:hypothetical protein
MRCRIHADTAQRTRRYVTENTQTLHRKAQTEHGKYTTQRMHGHGTENIQAHHRRYIGASQKNMQHIRTNRTQGMHNG